MRTQGPILSLLETSKRYVAGGQTVAALDHAVLDIHAGEVTGIVGPSGSGKTTLLMIAGLIEPPTSGDVRLDGRRVFADAAEPEQLAELRRKHFGFVFQKPNLIPFLNARENVQIALEIGDLSSIEARERAEDLLDHLGVAKRAESMPHQLSGGEQQRVAICRALANEPRLLLADEPTASLDGKRARQVMDLFSMLAEDKGIAVMTVTHDNRWTEHFHRIYELEDGKIVTHRTGRRLAS